MPDLGKGIVQLEFDIRLNPEHTNYWLLSLYLGQFYLIVCLPYTDSEKVGQSVGKKKNFIDQQKWGSSNMKSYIFV